VLIQHKLLDFCGKTAQRRHAPGMDRREGCVYAVRRAVRSEARTRSEASAARRRDRRDVSPARSRGGGIRPGPAGVRVGSRARRRRETPARRAGRPRSRWVRGLHSPARSSPRQMASRRSTVARSAVASSDRAADGRCGTTAITPRWACERPVDNACVELTQAVSGADLLRRPCALGSARRSRC